MCVFIFSSYQSTNPRPFLCKLAEAILSEPGPAAELEDVGSIRLTDTRTRDEQQFLVGDEEEENSDAEDGRSRSPSLDRGEGHGHGRHSLMSNAGAQLSRLDVHVASEDLHEADEVERTVSSSGLSAKAGIILVRFYDMFIILLLSLNHMVRAFTMSSS